MLTQTQLETFVAALDDEGHCIETCDVVPTRETVADWTAAQGKPHDCGNGLLEFRASKRTSVFVMDFGDARATCKI